jgi:hypothetical protein
LSSRAEIERRRVVTLFLKAGLVNTFAACVFTAPVLVPSLAFPILLTQWGAVYMVLGYLSFILYGVVGTVCWAMAYYLKSNADQRQEYDKALTYLQLATHLLAAYGTSTTLFTGGYIGARLVYEGRPVQAVGAVMEIVEIPAGLFILLAIASTIIGLINMIKK